MLATALWAWGSGLWRAHRGGGSLPANAARGATVRAQRCTALERPGLLPHTSRAPPPLVIPEAKYAASHEWAKVEGDTATVGISDHAQAELGDVVYVELPEVGATVTKGETFGVVESVKASGLRQPAGGG